MTSVIEVLGLAFSALSVTSWECIKIISLVLVMCQIKTLSRFDEENMKSL